MEDMIDYIVNQSYRLKILQLGRLVQNFAFIKGHFKIYISVYKYIKTKKEEE